MSPEFSFMWPSYLSSSKEEKYIISSPQPPPLFLNNPVIQKAGVV